MPYRSRIFWILCLNTTLLAGCSHRPPAKSLVLDYDDLGPHAATHSYIGDAWYQWNNHGSSRPNDRDAVFVVIYEGMGLSEVKRRYTVDERRNLDCRYLTLAKVHEALSGYEKELTGFSGIAGKQGELEEWQQKEMQRISHLREKLRIHFQAGVVADNSLEEDVPVITQGISLDGFVGKKVKLVGLVSNTKAPQILGVEVQSDSPDLRERMAEATGVLERYEVSAASVEDMRKRMIANRGAGTFYRLKDVNSGYAAQVRPR
jgi:hypothetical protein